MHYVPILDPGVSAAEPPGSYPPYDEGIKRDILVKDHTGKPFVAKVGYCFVEAVLQWCISDVGK